MCEKCGVQNFRSIVCHVCQQCDLKTADPTNPTWESCAWEEKLWKCFCISQWSSSSCDSCPLKDFNYFLTINHGIPIDILCFFLVPLFSCSSYKKKPRIWVTLFTLKDLNMDWCQMLFQLKLKQVHQFWIHTFDIFDMASTICLTINVR